VAVLRVRPPRETGEAGGRPELLLPRHPGDAVRLAAGLAIFAASTAMVHSHRVGVMETNVFRLVNDLPSWRWLKTLLWAVMQAGNLLAVGVTVGLALLARRLRLAVNLAAAGAGVWFLARAVKLLIARGRPPMLLTHVHLRGPPASGLGYVSGHAAVAVALASVASPYLGRRARRLAWAAAFGVCLSRMYVGAHLPLDVIGGAALGWAAGALVHLLLGAPGGRPSPERAARALVEHGLEAVEVVPLGGRDARRSARFRAATADGRQLFVKLIPRERRDADLLYRAWRKLLRLTLEPGPPAGPPAQQVEREAYLGLLAAAAGVRTPPVLLAGPYGNGAGMLVQRWVPGRSLEEGDPADAGDQVLRETWRQVARLHQAGIAHGDLTRASVVVDQDGQPWLVDFDHAEAAAGERRRRHDVAELLVSLAVRFGAERVAAAAAGELGPGAVDRALEATGPRDLTPATRAELRARPQLRDALQAAARGAADAPAPG
jgi:membrane-associated phospholipid phosphatase